MSKSFTVFALCALCLAIVSMFTITTHAQEEEFVDKPMVYDEELGYVDPIELEHKKPEKQEKKWASAIFAGGCFWCMEPPFERLKGVKAVYSGYTGGTTKNPTYKEVSYGNTGHYEAIEIKYDPEIVNYATLLKIYWRNVDPFDFEGQFCDKGHSYKAVIFVRNEEERELAKQTKEAFEDKFKKRITVAIKSADTFYKAEEYHQDYYKKNKFRYKIYRASCGRDSRLNEVWGKDARGEAFGETKEALK